MWELLERLLVPLDFVFLWQKHDYHPFLNPLDVSCFFSSMKVLNGIKTKMSSSDIIVSTTEGCFFRVNQQLRCTLQSKVLNYPNLNSFHKPKNANECVQFLFDWICAVSLVQRRVFLNLSIVGWQKLFNFRELFLTDTFFLKSDRLSFVMFVQNIKLSGQLGVRSISK